MGPIGLDLANACGRPFKPAMGKVATLADGGRAPIAGYVYLPMEVGGVCEEVRVAILMSLESDCYIGVNFARKFKAVLDSGDNTLLIRDSGEKVPLELASVDTRGPAIGAVGLNDLTPDQERQLQAMLDRVLSKVPQSTRLRYTHLLEHEIDVGNARPIKQRSYNYSPKVEEAMHEQVRELLDAGVLENASGGWANPVVMVKKANGKYRMCIDFRKVNAISKPDAYNLPRMDNILRKLRGAKYISTIDLKSAYHQVRLKKGSRPITAFNVPGMGFYQYKRLPFGLSQAGATFQRLLDMIIGPECDKYAYAYLDDVVIISTTFEEHLEKLEEVLMRLINANLTINREKSTFCQTEAKFLGVIIDRDGFRPDPDKVAPVVNYPTPKNLKALRRFLGMASWNRRFIADLATVSEPLTRLTKKNVKFVWGEEQVEAFDHIKALLATAPVLHSPDFKRPFIVQTDASDTGIGAVLLQNIDGEEKVLEYASRTLSRTEVKYSVTERECLAVVWAIKKFRPYLEGYDFKVITDHSSLRWLHSMNAPTGRLARWALELQEHNYTVEHRKGALNYVPDALSRMYEPTGPSVASVTWSDETADEWYLQRVAEIKEDPRRHPRMKLIGGVLYHYEADPIVEDALGDDEDSWKIVVPEEKRAEILRECHDDPVAGHMGREKTLARIKKRYFWPKMKNTVATHVRECTICQQVKVEQRAPAGLMGKRTIERPWQVVAGDVMGSLGKSKRGFEYVLVFEDLFSRWIECIPLRKANAPTILKYFMENVVLRFGTPEVFLSDNGTEFKNKLIDEKLQQLGIRHSTIPPYHPQANPVERVNRTLKQMIVAFAESHDRWDEHLHEFVFAYNTAEHSSTGISPAFLNYGRNPLPPDTAFRQQNALANENLEEQGVREWEQRVQRLEELHAHANEVSRASQERQARYYDAKRRDDSYEVGDLVWKENKILSSSGQGIRQKLAPKFAGPYRVTQILGSNTYELARPDGSVIKPVHIQQTKRCHAAPGWIEETLPPRDTEGSTTSRDAAVQDSVSPIASGPETPVNENGYVECVRRPKRKRGRPRKTVCVVQRPVAAPTPVENRRVSLEKRAAPKRRGRPPGSKNVGVDQDLIIPGRTRTRIR